MTHAVKISENLFNNAKINAKAFHRSTAGQIEYWAKIGQSVEQNPDMPFSFLQNILLGLEEISENKIEPFSFSS